MGGLSGLSGCQGQWASAAPRPGPRHAIGADVTSRPPAPPAEPSPCCALPAGRGRDEPAGYGGSWPHLSAGAARAVPGGHAEPGRPDGPGSARRGGAGGAADGLLDGPERRPAEEELAVVHPCGGRAGGRA